MFYEIFGVITNLIGGWLGARIGLNKTMNIGLVLQAVALAALLVPSAWLTVPWVMAAQALSGIAKDLNKMSAKSGIKTLVPAQKNDQLYKWVAALTGSKNTLKGVGFFLGGFLLWLTDFWWAIFCLLSLIVITGIASIVLLQNDLGRAKNKAKFVQLFSNNAAINWLSAARLFLFASRDVWFVVALPIALSEQFSWSHSQVGSFFALWIIGYGMIQGFTPTLTSALKLPTNGNLAFWLSTPLMLTTLLLWAIDTQFELAPALLIAMLFAFGFFFAMNSSVHSFLVVNWAREDGASLDVGFYYMSNALGRLLGTLLSGWLFMQFGLNAALFASVLMLSAVVVISLKLRQF